MSATCVQRGAPFYCVKHGVRACATHAYARGADFTIRRLASPSVSNCIHTVVGGMVGATLTSHFMQKRTFSTSQRSGTPFFTPFFLSELQYFWMQAAAQLEQPAPGNPAQTNKPATVQPQGCNTNVIGEPAGVPAGLDVLPSRAGVPARAAGLRLRRRGRPSRRTGRRRMTVWLPAGRVEQTGDADLRATTGAKWWLMVLYNAALHTPWAQRSHMFEDGMDCTRCLVKPDERTELKDRWHSGACAGPTRTCGQRYVRTHMASCSPNH
jgi:hypothetical protein